MFNIHARRLLVFLVFGQICVQSCGGPHALSDPEEAWMTEKMPQMDEYVMVEYQVRQVNCGLKNLIFGEDGLRWKVIVHFKDGEDKEYWAYMIAGINGYNHKFYAPIPSSMEELMARKARIVLISHDQREMFAQAYTLNGNEYSLQVNDDFPWEKISDEIKPGDHIKRVIKNSEQDWEYREQTVNEVARVLKEMTPAMRKKVEMYISARRRSYGWLVFQKGIEMVSQYFTGVIFTGEWLKPLYSLGIFQGAWLLGFLLQPANKLTPEYFGAPLTQRRFAVIMNRFHDSLSIMIRKIQVRQFEMQQRIKQLERGQKRFMIQESNDMRKQAQQAAAYIQLQKRLKQSRAQLGR